MWGGTDEAQSIVTIRSAVERGVTLIDTAPVYGFGRSEEIVGRAIAEARVRSGVLIATKAGVAWKDGEVFRDSRPTRIRQEIEGSLRRLHTDIIDLYQVHWPDLETCRDGTEPRGPVPRGQGLLAGKMTANTAFKGDDLRKSDPKFQGRHYQQYLAAVEELRGFSRQRFDKSVLALAVRWALDRGPTIALWGHAVPSKLDPIGEVGGWHIDEASKGEIDAILKRCIKDPVSPEFMAPPSTRP